MWSKSLFTDVLCVLKGHCKPEAYGQHKSEDEGGQQKVGKEGRWGQIWEKLTEELGESGSC